MERWLSRFDASGNMVGTVRSWATRPPPFFSLLQFPPTSPCILTSPSIKTQPTRSSSGHLRCMLHAKPRWSTQWALSSTFAAAFYMRVSQHKLKQIGKRSIKASPTSSRSCHWRERRQRVMKPQGQAHWWVLSLLSHT